MQLILDWIHTTYGAAAIDEAWREFTLGDEEAPSLEQATKHHQLFWPWCLYHWCPGALTDTTVADRTLHGVPPAMIFLEQHSGIEPVQRRYLEACLATPFSFHQILGGTANVGFHTRDLLSGKECHATHQPHPYPERLEPSDILYGQSVELDGTAKLEACATVAIPGRHATDLISRVIQGSSNRDLKLRAVYFELAGALLGTSTARPQVRVI